MQQLRLSLPRTASAPGYKPVVTVKELEIELARIEATDLSDLDDISFEREKMEFKQRSAKRMAEVQALEESKQKVRIEHVSVAPRLANMTFQRRRIQYNHAQAEKFYRHSFTQRERFVQVNEKKMWEEVQAKEVAEDKERKKEAQKKRRREKAMENEMRKLDGMQQRQDVANLDEEERLKIERDIQRSQKKIRDTKDRIEGNVLVKESRDATPQLNLESKAAETPQDKDAGNESTRRSKRSGPRLKKSKEQKQAEKDRAAAAESEIEHQDFITIAPKQEPAQVKIEEDSGLGEQQESTPASVPQAPSTRMPYVSEGYNNIVASIWKDLGRKDVNKLYRMKREATEIRVVNARKTAQLAAKEAKRWQLKTNKGTKDLQARAKRSMREMLSFWKRNERDERDQRKMAEKQELENAKKAEADREANRQKRKLNFLISQTELYSHFIGKKVRTDEVERSTDDVAVSGQTVKPPEPSAHTVTLPNSVAKLGTKVKNFEELDFDAEDETALQEAAMANAQRAVQEAQDRARAFDTEGQIQSQFDEGEMNFQNPTSLQSLDIPQPKMLSCQLKEYQLKGLNWLVNLYEQGINGILADEMGLGKTVQSISVMAYLAENHNIWGPFLVIAPSSTLHNWQQEVSKFVPDIKVLPYWGSAKDRKVLRKFWDRKHISYRRESPFHVLVTSYQLVVQDAIYFQKVKWQYMILDEAQAIKSSQSSRWKSLLGFHCRNRLLLTGTPIQNSMQELWALLHFIMPSLFDSHDEFSEWFSKDIESHAQSNTKLNEDQLKRLHMILKPFMLRRIKKHVQKELGDKVEEDVFCDLTYRQRAYYSRLRDKISIMDLIEKAAVGDEQDTATLMNLVMQFRKVCNHPDLFERADTTSPFSFSQFAETASFMREGHKIEVTYSVRNPIVYPLPRLVARQGGRLDLPGTDNEKSGWRGRYLQHMMNIWTPENIKRSIREDGEFAWLRFADTSVGEACAIAHRGIFERALDLVGKPDKQARSQVIYDGHDEDNFKPAHALFNISAEAARRSCAEVSTERRLHSLLSVSQTSFNDAGINVIEPCARPAASAPPIELFSSSQGVIAENQNRIFNLCVRRALYPLDTRVERSLLDMKLPLSRFPVCGLLPQPNNEKSRYTNITVPSMRRFVTDSGKLARLDRLLRQLKEGGHRVLLYFQMTRMIDLMEEYLTYRNYKYCRLDGSTKLEDRRDTVADFQTRPEIFVFLLSTRAGGLGINLTSADTVIFYDSDWNPTIDSQAMDRAHRLGQTKQVTVYRLITRGTIEERIRKRALQKEEIQQVVISGRAGAGVDFNTRSKENRTKDIALWLADDEQAAEIEKREQEVKEREEREGGPKKMTKKQAAKRAKEVSLDDMYHEGKLTPFLNMSLSFGYLCTGATRMLTIRVPNRRGPF